jgi:hypothetical protein
LNSKPAREIAAVQRITETEAVREIEAALAKGPRRGPKPAEEEAVVEERGGVSAAAYIAKTFKARHRRPFACI